MTVWLPGMRMTANRLNDNTVDEVTTSGLVPAADFITNSFSGRKVNGITTVHLYVQYTGAGKTIAPDPGGNLGDFTIATLPSGWRPPEMINAIEGDGITIGEVTISTTGVISLRATVSTIPTGRNMRVTASWISENA